MKGTLEERFWSRIEKTEACWLWTGTRKRPNGYGQISLNGRILYAHRYSYELLIGPIPEGLVIDHLCHNKRCVNPDHLAAVTQKQNIENRAGANRNSRSGVRGVSWHSQSGKWRAQVRHNRKPVSVGLFSTIEEAEAATIAKRSELFTHSLADKKRALQ